MKTLLSLTTIAALAASGSLCAQTAFSKPSGYISLGDTTAGQPAVKANTDVYISIPLLKSSVYQGTVQSIASNQITLSGTPGFTANAYASPTNPHVLVVENGPLSGLIALITANTSTAVTIAVQSGDSVATLTASASISIRPAWTVGNIFSGNTIPTGVLVSVFGGRTGVNLAADNIYEFNGTIWEDTDSLEDASNIVLYPCEGILLRTGSTSISSLTISGEVSTANSRSVIQKYSARQQDNWISYMSPVAQPISSSGLGVSTGDLLIERSNSVAGRNKPAIKIYEKTSNGWEDTDSLDDVTLTLSLQPGKSYVYRRAGNSIGSTVISSIPSFVSSL